MSAETTAAAVTPGPGQGEAARSRSRHRRRWLLGAGGLLAAAALVAAITLGATYQPVTYGMAQAAVQGQVSIHAVNDFEGMRGQIYIPPQPATKGALIVGLINTGPYPVAIESVSIIANGEPSYPTALNNQTGPATYVPLAATGLGPHLTGSSPAIANATLRPGENVLIRIPFRTPSCWYAGRSLVSTFWVTTKFLWWTHTFAVSWTAPGDLYGGAIMSELPDPNGGAGSLCPRR
jgi:hypothetical protein